MPPSTSDNNKKIVLITGGNTGLGLEIVRALCGQSDVAYEIVIGSRSLSKADSAISQIRGEFPSTTSTLSSLQVDLTSDESLASCVSELEARHGRLDALVNNGGASYDTSIGGGGGDGGGTMSIREAFNATWDVNVSGTHVLTTMAVPLLLRSRDPRLLFLTSGTSPLAETERTDTPTLARLNGSPAAGWPKDKGMMPMTAYRSSKTGLNMVMREWTRILANDGVKVWSISPGFLATGLAGVGAEKLKQLGALDPSVGGNFIKDVLQGKRDHQTGKAIREHEIQPW